MELTAYWAEYPPLHLTVGGLMKRFTAGGESVVRPQDDQMRQIADALNQGTP